MGVLVTVTLAVLLVSMIVSNNSNRPATLFWLALAVFMSTSMFAVSLTRRPVHAVLTPFTSVWLLKKKPISASR